MVKPTKATTKPQPSQPALFRKIARELGCDEDEAAFEERLKKIAKTTPPRDEKPRPPKGKG